MAPDSTAGGTLRVLLRQQEFLAILAHTHAGKGRAAMTGTRMWLIAGGAALILIAMLIRWRTARYDLKDAAFDSAWTVLRGRRTPDNPTALEDKFNEIRAQPTWTGRATRAAGTVAGHFVAQALAVTALALTVAGAALIAFAMLWG
jgi:hypothetical protein